MEETEILQPGDQITCVDQVEPHMIVRVDNHDNPLSVYDGFSTVAVFLTPPFVNIDESGHHQRQAVLLFNEGLLDPALPWYLQQDLVQAAGRVRLSDFDIRRLYWMAGKPKRNSRGRIYYLGMAEPGFLKPQIKVYGEQERGRQAAKYRGILAREPMILTQDQPDIATVDDHAFVRFEAESPEGQRYQLRLLRMYQELVPGMKVGIYRPRHRSLQSCFEMNVVGSRGVYTKKKHHQLSVDLTRYPRTPCDYLRRYTVNDLGLCVSKRGNRSPDARIFALIKA